MAGSIAGRTPIPFSEPPYLCGLPSPYYTPELRQWQKACRAFITEHLTQHAWDWEKEETVPEHVYEIFAKNHMLIPSLGAPLPVQQLKACGIHDILGVVKVEDWTYFHTLIYTDEMIRSGLAGPGGSLTVGFAFGLPPILKFGSQRLQERFLPDCFAGRKRICIAITEPDAGSDVANIKTTAVKSGDAKKYIVSGSKKWYAKGLKVTPRICLSGTLTFSTKGSQTESGATTPPWPSEPAVPAREASPCSSCPSKATRALTCGA